jgi:hypothetical protein
MVGTDDRVYQLTDTIEILLLLLWRHLQHFLSPNSPSIEDAGSFMRSVSAPLRRPAVIEHLRSDAEIAIREITLKLDEVQVVRRSSGLSDAQLTGSI